ncbi:hypothetical protein D3C85_491810 [compost metagenome]
MVPTSGLRIGRRHQREISAAQIARSRKDDLEREDEVREKVMHRLDVKKPAQGGLGKKKRARRRRKSRSALLHAQTVLRQQGPTAQSRHDDTAGAARRGAEHDGDRVAQEGPCGRPSRPWYRARTRDGIASACRCADYELRHTGPAAARGEDRAAPSLVAVWTGMLTSRGRSLHSSVAVRWGRRLVALHMSPESPLLLDEPRDLELVAFDAVDLQVLTA